jgi:hypothetical protein
MHRATIRATVPDLNTFIVRGVVPLPRGYNEEQPNNRCPFTVWHPTTYEACTTQWEPVSFYPSAPGDAREVASAEILAHVPRSGMVPGTQEDFQVSDDPQPWAFPSPAPEAVNMVMIKSAIRLRATDFYGNVYEASLSRDLFKAVGGGPSGLPTGPGTLLDSRTHRFGAAMATIENHGWLSRVGPGTPESLPWLLGWQAFLTARTGSDILELTLNVHNAFCAVPYVAPTGHAYFRDLSLVLPKGWEMQTEWEEPASGNPTPDAHDAFYVVPLVRANDDGTMHMMAQHGEREWRLTLYETGNETAAEEIRAQRGWGTARPGISEEAGGEALWSWSNPETANYQAQCFPVPDLDHVHDSCVDKVLGWWDSYYEALASGSSLVYKGSEAFGYYHPYGVSYGGMTGGSEIFPFDGLEVIQAGLEAGLSATRALHYMYSCRQPGAIYTIKGQPLWFETMLADGSRCDWNYFNAGWTQKQDGAYGFVGAPNQHRDEIEAAGQLPTYEDKLTRDIGSYSSFFQPIDFQHYVRRTRSCRTLVWLDNDPLAKRKLQMLAEIGMMHYHAEPSSTTAGVHGKLAAVVTDNPGATVTAGRGDAWVLDAAAAAYATAPKVWRDRPVVRTWFNTAVSTFRAALTPAGIAIGTTYGKQATQEPFNGNYIVCQCFEQCLLAHAVRGVLKSVLEGVSQIEELAREFVVLNGAPGIADYMWREGTGGTWNKVAAGTIDGVIFNSVEARPAAEGVYGAYPMVWHIVPAMAYALAEPGLKGEARDLLIKRVGDYAGGVGDPLLWFEGQGLKMIENRAPLLAWLQLDV